MAGRVQDSESKGVLRGEAQRASSSFGALQAKENRGGNIHVHADSGSTLVQLSTTCVPNGSVCVSCWCVFGWEAKKFGITHHHQSPNGLRHCRPHCVRASSRRTQHHNAMTAKAEVPSGQR